MLDLAVIVGVRLMGREALLLQLLLLRGADNAV